jgi:hypothetical protein
LLALGGGLLLLEVSFTLLVQLIDLHHLIDHLVLLFLRGGGSALLLTFANIDAILPILLFHEIIPVNLICVNVVL